MKSLWFCHLQVLVTGMDPGWSGGVTGPLLAPQVDIVSGATLLSTAGAQVWSSEERSRCGHRFGDH
jgi:hypothetical protein